MSVNDAPGLPPSMINTLATVGLQELLFAPISKVARALAGFDREQLGIAIEVMIAMLDAAEPDPDIELNGDEADGLGGEDDFSPQSCPMHLQGAGCPISDPDVSVDDGPIDGDEGACIPRYDIDQTRGLLPLTNVQIAGRAF